MSALSIFSAFASVDTMGRHANNPKEAKSPLKIEH